MCPPEQCVCVCLAIVSSLVNNIMPCSHDTDFLSLPPVLPPVLPCCELPLHKLHTQRQQSQRPTCHSTQTSPFRQLLTSTRGCQAPLLFHQQSGTTGHSQCQTPQRCNLCTTWGGGMQHTGCHSRGWWVHSSLSYGLRRRFRLLLWRCDVEATPLGASSVAGQLSFLVVVVRSRVE